MTVHTPADTRPDLRHLLASAIEFLIAISDQIDGGPELEPEPDLELESNFEPSLGSLDMRPQTLWGISGTDDLESLGGGLRTAFECRER